MKKILAIFGLLILLAACGSEVELSPEPTPIQATNTPKPNYAATEQSFEQIFPKPEGFLANQL